MKEFMLGANYWASNAGADMWREWDADVVRSDLALLAENGVTTLRVFPNWRDFQPVEPAITGAHKLREYILAGGPVSGEPLFPGRDHAGPLRPVLRHRPGVRHEAHRGPDHRLDERAAVHPGGSL